MPTLRSRNCIVAPSAWIRSVRHRSINRNVLNDQRRTINKLDNEAQLYRWGGSASSYNCFLNARSKDRTALTRFRFPTQVSARVAILLRAMSPPSRAHKVRDPPNGRYHPATVTRPTWHPFHRHQVCEALYQCSSRSLASRPNNRHRNCCFFLQRFSFSLHLSPTVSSVHSREKPRDREIWAVRLFTRDPSFALMVHDLASL